MVIDTSAVVAILLGEGSRAGLLSAIENSPTRLISAVSVYEASIVIQARLGGSAGNIVRQLLSRLLVDVVAFDATQASLAADAYCKWGKGRHPAGLNMGDCASYALAEYHRLPLLFIGDDFAITDVRKVK